MSKTVLPISKQPRSRHCSMVDRNTETGKSRTRHMSMQDRLDMYNRDLEDQNLEDLEDAGNTARPERVRKTSVLFDQPQVTITGGVINVVETEAASLNTEVEVHQVRDQVIRGLKLYNDMSPLQAPLQASLQAPVQAPPPTNQPANSKTRKVSKVSMFEFVPEEQ